MMSAICAILLGWCIDREIRKRELITTVETMESLAAIDELIARKKALEYENPDELANWIDGILAEAIVDLFENSLSIDRYMRNQNRNDNALYITNNVLTEIDCESVDDYFSRLDPSTHERFIDYKNPDTAKHEGLEKFVVEAIASPKPLDLLLDEIKNLMQLNPNGR